MNQLRQVDNYRDQMTKNFENFKHHTIELYLGRYVRECKGKVKDDDLLDDLVSNSDESFTIDNEASIEKIKTNRLMTKYSTKHSFSKTQGRF